MGFNIFVERLVFFFYDGVGLNYSLCDFRVEEVVLELYSIF